MCVQVRSWEIFLTSTRVCVYVHARVLTCWHHLGPKQHFYWITNTEALQKNTRITYSSCTCFSWYGASSGSIIAHQRVCVCVCVCTGRSVHDVSPVYSEETRNIMRFWKKLCYFCGAKSIECTKNTGQQKCWKQVQVLQHLCCNVLFFNDKHVGQKKYILYRLQVKGMKSWWLYIKIIFIFLKPTTAGFLTVY